ncbi:unannotated protein [freshwater metagenome]|uniref:Unannotated protein n=1 Tax=freshwater metagenome TaxID=449393 RepID=A0A6J7TXX8_9ZZZZ
MTLSVPVTLPPNPPKFAPPPEHPVAVLVVAFELPPRAPLTSKVKVETPVGTFQLWLEPVYEKVSVLVIFRSFDSQPVNV